MPYNRPATTIDEKIEILKNRGLQISNRKVAREIIRAVGYFRLKGYCLVFYGEEYERFLPDTTIEQVYNIYQFDIAFRALMLSACQQIEVRVKAAMGDRLPLDYGPTLSAAAFQESEGWKKWNTSLRQSRGQGSRRKEPYISNYDQRYGEFPLWVDLELVTMGSLSILYSWLTTKARKAVAAEFGVPHLYLGNWLLVLTVLRNTCAHNSRLFGRQLSKPVRLPNKYRKQFGDRQSSFGIWYILRMLLPAREFGRYVFQLSQIFDQYQMTPWLDQIGFPDDWQTILLSEF